MEKMMKDRVVIITGSGRGIGKAAALMFAKEGARVVVSDIDPEPAEETASEIINAGGAAITCMGDVTADDFADRIVGAAADKWGALHIIVNNAGFTWDGLVHKMTDAQWDAVLDLHLKAPFRIIRAATPFFVEAAKAEMKSSGRPVARKIVNVSSVSGVSGNLGQANYASAKSGIIGLTKTICKEWGRYNVQSNCVAFGLIDTRLSGEKELGAKVDAGNETIDLGIPKRIRDNFAAMIPMGRFGTPEEAAAVLFFFASPLSDYISGQVLVCGGGFGM